MTSLEAVCTYRYLLYVWGALFAAGGLASPLLAQSVSGFEKTSPRVLYHRALKALERPDGAAGKALDRRRLGLDLTAREAERVALHVRARLTADEIAEFADGGVTIAPWAWVAPVAGRHPHGYYLARVRYDSLDGLERDPRVMRIESTEFLLRWHNDLATDRVGVPRVRDDGNASGATGVGVKLAIADTGLDLTHADLPTPTEAFDLTDGLGQQQWGADVTDLTSGHGTHVAGTAVGNGLLSGGRYRGVAPDAELYFYKVAEDGDSRFLQTEALLQAVIRATSVGCDVFSLSAGGLDPYMDGSGPLCQAVDAGTAGGMVSFVSAGNDGGAGIHRLVEIGPRATSEPFGYTIDNRESPFPYVFDELILVVWRDGPATTELRLNGNGNTAVVFDFADESLRGTRSAQFRLPVDVPAGDRRTYTLELSNMATCEAALAHVYSDGFGIARFEEPTAGYVVSSPAIADTAIAVGAWTTRLEWTNLLGLEYAGTDLFPDDLSTVDKVATFSSPGPRIDGVRKPSFVAPGAWVISCRDSVGVAIEFESGLAAGAELPTVIDNDGEGLDGSGPADYLILSGTSMSCPLAAGAACLLLEAYPDLEPAELTRLLEETAGPTWDSVAGHGVLDLEEATLRAGQGPFSDCVGRETDGADCDGSGVSDLCELRSGLLADCDASGVPDVCELSDGTLPDCDGNSVPDACEIAGSPALDCDGNGRLDVCDLSISAVFEEQVLTIPEGTGPRRACVSDLDGDGAADLVVLNQNGSLSVLTGSGDGFARTRDRTIAGDPRALSMGDLSGDGLEDAVVVSLLGSGDHRSAQVVVFEGVGGVAFGTETTYDHNAATVVTLEVRDLNNDGAADLTILNSDPETLTVFVVVGGTVGIGKSYPLGRDPNGMALGDVDADGTIDIIVTTADGVELLRGTGTGRFSLPETQELGVGQPTAPALADLGGDERLELACVVNRCDTLAVFQNDGTGSFGDAQELSVGDAPLDLVAADINADGALDLVVASQRARTLGVAYNEGPGSGVFTEVTQVGIAGRPESIAAVGFAPTNGPFLVTANRSDDALSVLRRSDLDVGTLDCNGNGQLDRCEDVAELSACGGTRFFVRGDANDSGATDISDGVAVFGYLFLGAAEPTCLESSDTDNDGEILITDGISLLNHLFLGGIPPAVPGPLDCGEDPDPPGSHADLGCEQFTSCSVGS